MPLVGPAVRNPIRYCPIRRRLSQPPASGERGKPRKCADFQRNGAFERSEQPNVNRFRSLSTRRAVRSGSSIARLKAGHLRDPERLRGFVSAFAASSSSLLEMSRNLMVSGHFVAGPRTGRRQKQARVCGAAATVRSDVMRYDWCCRNCRRSATIGLHPSRAWTGRRAFSELPPHLTGE